MTSPGIGQRSCHDVGLRAFAPSAPESLQNSCFCVRAGFVRSQDCRAPQARLALAVPSTVVGITKSKAGDKPRRCSRSEGFIRAQRTSHKFEVRTTREKHVAEQPLRLDHNIASSGDNATRFADMKRSILAET
jgi:hypothetical protein